MEKIRKSRKLPTTDLIQELARFWDNHDLADFDKELEEIREPVFIRDDSVFVRLSRRDAKAVRRLAESRGVSQADLIREWISQELGRRKRRSG
jgi:predicted DNA binding CopG/RHH family protein